MAPQSLPLAPAVFLAWQEWPGEQPLALFNLTAAIPGHGEGSTIVAETLTRAGYSLPPFPAAVA